MSWPSQHGFIDAKFSVISENLILFSICTVISEVYLKKPEFFVASRTLKTDIFMGHKESTSSFSARE
jgi:hypothetical protein